MNSFNFNRFCHTLRWVLSVNFRNMMFWTLGSFVGVFLGEMAVFGIFSQLPEKSVNIAASFGVIFIVIGLLACFSSVMSDVNKKTKRTVFLMLPASNLEKFLSLVFYVTVVWTACVIVSLVAGDFLRMAVRAVFYGDEWVSVLPQLMRDIQPDGFARLWLPEMLFLLLLNVFTHSMYILGGTWLRKYAFVCVSIVLIAIPVIMSYAISPAHISLFSWQDAHGGHYVNPVVYVIDVVFVVLSCLNYWASFQIFKHFELITNKWTNYDIFKR